MNNNIYTYDAKLNEIVTPKKDLVFKRIFGKKDVYITGANYILTN